MASSVDQLVVDVSALDTVVDSAVLLINGFSQRLTDAIAEALAGGATADELKPLTVLSDDIKARTQALGDAVAASTVVAPRQAGSVTKSHFESDVPGAPDKPTARVNHGAG